jgi:hypothetical protein
VSFRRLISLGAVSLLLAAACTGQSPPLRPERTDGERPRNGGPIPREYRPFVRTACGLPQTWLQRIWRGYLPGRSGELEILPRQPNFVGSGLPHVGPWEFVERVPMFWYGPGFIRAQGAVDRPVTSAGIAPTQAELLGYEHRFPDGQPMTEALLPEGDRAEPPRIILTLVWDGAGRNVLSEWPDAWPNLRGLMREGTWFENATVGSSPTSSAQIHATIGTGAFPRRHGLVGHSLRTQNGDIIAPWRDGPGQLLLPTLADLYDQAMGNEPIVGGLGTAAIQLGFLGHGAAREGGDRDLAVLREAKNAETLAAEGGRWNLDEDLRAFYEFPEYANDLPSLRQYRLELDAADGARDGRWLGHAFSDDLLQRGFHTPARIPYQTRLIEEVIEREGFGADEVPDLLFLNYKVIDYVGHTWTLNGPEMRDTLRTQDEYLPALVEALDRAAGEGRWAMLLTSDHGSTPSPDVSGAFRISSAAVHSAVNSFDSDGDDTPVAETVKQTEIFVNEAELEENGFTLADVAERLMELTQQETVIPGDPIRDPNAKVFAAAFPSELLEALPCLAETRGRE